MANLIFKYSTMNSGKTLSIIQIAETYAEKDLKCIVIKPQKDTTNEDSIVCKKKLSKKVDILLGEEESLFQSKYYKKYYGSRIILVDEVELLTSDQVEELWTIAHLIKVPVIAFGLKSNFAGEIFSDAVSKLLACADIIEEMGSISLCSCGAKATFNARKVNGKYTDEGKVVVLNGEDENLEYEPLCGDCFLKFVKLKGDKVKKLGDLVKNIK